MTGEPVKLVVPGLGGSGPGHWQSLWSAGRKDWVRLEQREWNAPSLEDWLGSLDAAVRAIDGTVILVAHSLGAVLVGHWGLVAPRPNVVAALLVAPADVDAARAVPVLQEFAPAPRGRLPFRTWVVASTNDPFCGFARARELASGWGARFVSAGAAGHVNVASGHGPWPGGQELLRQVVASESVGWRSRRTG